LAGSRSAEAGALGDPALPDPSSPEQTFFDHQFVTGGISVVDLGLMADYGRYSPPNQPRNPNKPRSLAGDTHHGGLERHSTHRYHLHRPEGSHAKPSPATPSRAQPHQTEPSPPVQVQEAVTPAALHGVLARIEALGLELLEVSR
jgi:hypothetical protein